MSMAIVKAGGLSDVELVRVWSMGLRTGGADVIVPRGIHVRSLHSTVSTPQSVQ